MTTICCQGVVCGSSAFPDIKAISEKPNSPELSPEAHAEFRRVLGKLAWFTQTREDLHVAISLISAGLRVPTACHAEALRALLRFLRKGGDVRVHFPSPEATSNQPCSEVSVFADASYVPNYEVAGPRVIAGGVIILHGWLDSRLLQHFPVAKPSCTLCRLWLKSPW